MLDVNRLVYGKLVYPAVVRFIGEGALFSRLAELEAIQWWNPSQLAQYQARRLADILNFAASRSPHFRDVLPSPGSVTPEGALSTLTSIPFLTKTDLQNDVQRMLAKPSPRRLTYKTTGGSTGQAVTIAKDRDALAYERAAMWLGYGWSGIRFGDRCARFWGSQFDGRRRLAGHAGDFAMNRMRFSAFAFDDSDMEGYWQRCVAFQPTYLYGYVSMLEAFAEYVERQRYDGRALGVRAVITTSEVLSSPQRDTLSRVFGARVAVEYGCGEVGPIAYECERGSLHVMSADLIVEVVDTAGNPTSDATGGQIVLTDLNSKAMPLIRYCIGDNGVIGRPCGCGRGFGVLEKIWGRAYDIVQGPDGRQYHGEFFMYLFEDLRKLGHQIRQFQVVQDQVDHITIRLVTDSAEVNGVTRALIDELTKRLPEMAVTVRPEQQIERSPSGKAQVVRNLLPRAVPSA